MAHMESTCTPSASNPALRSGVQRSALFPASALDPSTPLHSMTVVHATTRQGAGLQLAHALAHASTTSHRDGHAAAATEDSRRRASLRRFLALLLRACLRR